MSELLKWLKENNVVGFFIVIIFIGAIIATVYIVKAIARFKKMEKACGDIPDMNDKIKFGVNLSNSIEKKIDAQTDKFNSLNTSINSLVAFLTTKHGDLQSAFFKSNSPIQLTEVGLDLLTKSGGKDYIDKNATVLVTLLENENFKSALDVQNKAMIVVFNEFSTDNFITIRNYIFQNPIYRFKEGNEISINQGSINQIMGIYLRDKYFEKHPELKDVEPTK